MIQKLFPTFPVPPSFIDDVPSEERLIYDLNDLIRCHIEQAVDHIRMKETNRERFHILSVLPIKKNQRETTLVMISVPW